MIKDKTEAVPMPMQQVPPAEQDSAKGLYQREVGEGETERSSKASDLQDRRHGAYDNLSANISDATLPEGLRRERKGALSPTRGRSTKAARAKRND